MRSVDFCNTMLYNLLWYIVPRSYHNGRRLALIRRVLLFNPPERRVVHMVTYSDLFLLINLIVSVIALVVSIIKKK